MNERRDGAGRVTRAACAEAVSPQVAPLHAAALLFTRRRLRYGRVMSLVDRTRTALSRNPCELREMVLIPVTVSISPTSGRLAPEGRRTLTLTGEPSLSMKLGEAPGVTEVTRPQTLTSNPMLFKPFASPQTEEVSQSDTPC